METEIILEAIKEIKTLIALNTTHITTINHEMGAIQADVAVLKAQVAEMMWWCRAIFGAFIVLFASQIWKAIVSHRNNKNGRK